MTQPPRWSEKELEIGISKAKALFREERLQEPLEAYTASFDHYKGAIESLLALSVELT